MSDEVEQDFVVEDNIVPGPYFKTAEGLREAREKAAQRSSGTFRPEEEQLLVQHLAAQILNVCEKACDDQSMDVKKSRAEQISFTGFPQHEQEIVLTIPYVACIFFRVFYARRSLTEFNAEVVMLTSILLATKVEDIRGGPEWFTELCARFRGGEQQPQQQVQGVAAGSTSGAAEVISDEEKLKITARNQKLVDTAVGFELSLIEALDFRLLLEKPFAVLELLLDGGDAQSIALDVIAESARLDLALFSNMRLLALTIIVASATLGELTIGGRGARGSAAAGRTVTPSSPQFWGWVLRNAPSGVVTEDEKKTALTEGAVLAENVRTRRATPPGSPPSKEVTAVSVKLKQQNRASKALKKRKTES